MQVFLFPAVILAFAFWSGMLITYYFLRARVNALARRVRRIEKQLGGPRTEDFRQGQYVQPHRPRPLAPSRYVTVDHEINPEFYQQR